MSKVLKKFDMFGKAITLNFQKEDVYQTECGGFFTIMFVILSVYFSVGQIDDFLHKCYYIFTILQKL